MRHNSIPLNFGCRGRFRAIVHDGKGNVLRETPFGRNRITMTGFNQLLGAGTFHTVCVAGSGNNPPQESDSTLQSYRGKYNTIASSTNTYNTDPGAGPIFHRLTRRFTFNPGSFGASSVNISEAGIACTVVLNSVNASSPVGARGLLVDSGGSPTSVAVAPEEFLDIVWELTIYPQYEVAGTFTIVIDDVPTVFNYTMRPSNVPNQAVNNYRWFFNIDLTLGIFFSPGSSSSVSLGNNGSGLANRPAGLIDIALSPGNLASADHRPATITSAGYVANSRQRSYEAVWTLVRGNMTGGANMVYLDFGYATYQMLVTPNIMKTAARQLNLPFMIALANAA